MKKDEAKYSKKLQEMLAFVPFMMTYLRAVQLVREQSTADAARKLELEVEIYLLMSGLAESTIFQWRVFGFLVARVIEENSEERTERFIENVISTDLHK